MTSIPFISSPLSANERRLLNIVRQNGVLPRHKIVSHVGVTAQAVGQITRRLDQHELLIHHKAVTVGLGQPPKPISINPNGAFSIGIKLGRRHTDVVLLDLLGKVRERHTIHYAYPVSNELLPKIAQHLANIQKQLEHNHFPLTGVGVAAPYALGGWHTMLGLPLAQAQEWNHLDLSAAIGAMTPRPVILAKDTAAACVAELLNGQGKNWQNFLYLFVDTFIGGSVVSQGRLLDSKHGNAGAVASLPTSIHQPLDQLVGVASLWELEQNPSDAQAWVASASRALAFAIVSGTAFLDTDAVVIDGSMPPQLLSDLIKQTENALEAFNWQGLWRPKLLAGIVGADAGALGGGLLPLHEYFYA